VERLLVLVAVSLLACTAASIVQRRNYRHSVRTGSPVPVQIHRGDFPHPEIDWLIAIFTSESCDACTAVLRSAQSIDSAAVHVAKIDSTKNEKIYKLYDIDAVPLLLLANKNGVVLYYHRGPIPTDQLYKDIEEATEGTLTINSYDTL